ncbi:MAG: hypothetical protein AAF753_07040 [Pseudomonadota bacterium]
MARRLDGRSALRRIDGLIADARGQLGEAIAAADELAQELTEVRREQASAYRDLAAIQLGEADTPAEIAELENLDRDVGALMADHGAYLKALLEDLEAASAEVAGLERARRDAAEALDAAVAAYEAKVDAVEAELEEDEAYLEQAKALADAEAVAEKARAKLALARSDMEDKGAVFRGDPLFMYLWSRRFRTPDYEAGNLVRFLDGWVARLCNYDGAYRTYERLVELPEWLEEHVAAMERRQGEAEDDLAEAEAAALTEAGADALAEAVDSGRAALEELDAGMASAEARHLEIAAQHTAAEQGAAGPADEARQRLANALKQRGIPDLRVLAAQTVTEEDDALVDRLVILRKDEMAMELRLERDRGLPSERRSDLAQLEAFRRSFKAARMDSSYASYRASDVEDVAARMAAGRMAPRDGVRRLKRGMRRASPRTDPRFGGPRRARTMGLPDAAVGIGLEILKEMGRSSGRSGGFGLGGGVPGGLPRGRRTSRRPPSFPSRGRRGKFKTGGGF